MTGFLEKGSISEKSEYPEQIPTFVPPVESQEVCHLDAIEKEIERTLSREDAGFRNSGVSSTWKSSKEEVVHDEHAPLSQPASKEDIEKGAKELRAGDGTGYPDGGVQAWTCVLGAWLCLISGMGIMNSIGVFQAYYKSHLIPEYSNSAIGWIASIQLALMFGGGTIAGPCFDIFGPKYMLLGSTVVFPFGLMMISISSKYWQLFLAQAIVVALASAFSFYPAINSVSTWFFKRRALAIGLTTTGGSVGGVIMPIIISKAMPVVGFGWAVRILGFLVFVLLGTASVLVKSRLEHPKSLKGKFPVMFDFMAFKDLTFFYFNLGALIQIIGIWAPINFLASFAQSRGLSLSMSFNLLAILNAGSFFGRAIPGLLADRFGRITIFWTFSTLSGVLILAMWSTVNTHVAIIAFAALYGAFSGAFLSLYPACAAQLSPIDKIGLRLGTLNTVCAVGSIISLPLHGSLIHGHDYSRLIYFAGAMLVGGGLPLLASIYYAKKNLNMKRP